MAHVSQIARMRLMQDDTAAGSKAVHTPSVAAPMTDEVLWDKLRLGSFVLFHLRSDPKSYVRCGEVTQVDHAARQFTVWFNNHRVPTLKGERYNFERPQFGGAGGAQARGGGDWGAGSARATIEDSFTSITRCSNACARAGS